MSKIKNLSLLMFLMLGAFAFGTTSNASADIMDEDIIKSLPDGVERYYPKNPESLKEFEPTDLESIMLNNGIMPAIGEQLPRYVNLTKSQKTATTTRITLEKGNTLGVSVTPIAFGPRGTLVMTLFRSGEYYQSYIFSKKTKFGDILNVLPMQYSMRLYCGNPDELETGCQAEGALSVGL